MSGLVGTWTAAEEANFVAGSWRQGSSGQTVANISPSNRNDEIGRFSSSTPQDVSDAAEAALVAADAWAGTSPIHRSRLLRSWSRVIEEHAEQFARDLTREAGKTLREAHAEVVRGAAMLDYYAGVGQTLGGRLNASDRAGFRSETRTYPVGVVGVVSPWNFPFAIPAWKIAPALIAGNCVILKPAPATPMSAVNLVRAAEAAGIPTGVLQLVHGGAQVGGALVEHPALSAIAFTGSTAVGRTLYSAAAQRHKPVQAEMGGNNAFTVLPDADIGSAVRYAVEAAYLSAGQRCTATRRVLLHSAIGDDFLHQFLEAVQGLTVGDPFDSRTDMGPVVSDQQLAVVLEGVERAKSEGARVLQGGRPIVQGPLAAGAFMEPTILGEVAPYSKTGQEELFGPVVSIFEFGDLDEAIQLNNCTPYGLSAAIFTQDLDAAEYFVQRSDTGVVAVNAPTAGIDVQAPLRGAKASGLGPPELGTEALDFFRHPKAVYIRTGGSLK